MGNLTKALTAAAGNAATPLYVEDVFSTYLYEGTGAAQTITNGIDLAGEGGLVWLKNRTQAVNHGLTDTARGVDKILYTNNTDAEASGTWGVNQFNSNGFGVTGSDSVNNASTQDFASWTFRKAEKFFDVVTYTGTGSATTISHNLGSTPAVIIFKRTDVASGNWPVYVSSLGAADLLRLNITNAYFTSSDYFNDTAPTDSVFTVGISSNVNASGGSYVAYLFASDAGGFGADGSESIIKCGSFTVPASAPYDTEVNLGFEPQWLLIKGSSNTENWDIHDNMRGITAGSEDNVLYANLSSIENEGYDELTLTPTGFIANPNGLAPSATYTYIAIRRPMKTPTAGTEVFDFISRTGTGVAATVASPILTDVLWSVRPSLVNANYSIDRMRGGPEYLETASSNAAGSSGTSISEFGNDYIEIAGGLGTVNTNGSDYLYYLFKRAAGFFDVVAFDGNTAGTYPHNHNLTVVPELIILKSRSVSGSWEVATDFTATGWRHLYLNETNAGASETTYATNDWHSAQPTATTFSTGGIGAAPHIAYLFASLAGVSKVGSYTGTAATLNVDCGFSAGARFILIKRTDVAGDWYVWDTERGIVAGNDPYLFMNSTAVEVTSTDYIDPLSSGFTVTSSAPAALNASGGTYIFLAIA